MTLTQMDYRTLGLLSETLSDLEEVRIRMENRLRSLTMLTSEEDGTLHGFGMDADEPMVQEYVKYVANMQEVEKQSIKVIQKALKNSPLGAFVASQKGLGEKTVARLLGSIGDPYWHTVEDRPRRVGELWAYCGMDVRGGKAPRRTKGTQSNWNSEARKRVWLIAKSVEKQSSGKYRTIYDTSKLQYSMNPHTQDCAQCKAKAGEPLKPGHAQARALRKVAKEVLKDLWLESRKMHEEKELPAAA